MTRRKALRAAGAVTTLLVLAPAAASAAPERFAVIPEASRVEFVSGTQMGEFRGGTAAVTGEIVYDPDDPSRPRVALSVDAGRLESDNAARDKHMRERVLEVSRFPAITLTATTFRPAGETAGTLEGRLALHGVERPLGVPVRFAREGAALRADARFDLALADFGMTPPRLLGLKVRDTVTVLARIVAGPVRAAR
ncbi:MAG TPA: YceI family protein [Thermodesulfobacteriota bacterium]